MRKKGKNRKIQVEIGRNRQKTGKIQLKMLKNMENWKKIGDDRGKMGENRE